MEKLLNIIGILVLLTICYALSTDRKKIDWRLVGFGILLQLVFALIILKLPLGQAVFSYLNDVVLQILNFTSKGAEFVFGSLVSDRKTFGFIFAFNVLPTIIFFSAFMAILYHLGIMQKLIYFVAMIMQKTLKTSGAESISAAANIFVGQTEAPLVIKPYVEKMTISELHCVMAGGMATIAGGVMAGYVGMLADSIPNVAGHLIAASVMAAPAAMVFAKMLIPETEIAETSGKMDLSGESIDANVIDACARGCSEGMGLAINIAAMLIGFTAMIALVNHMWGIFAGLVGLTSVNTLDSLLGYIASPFAYLLGIPKNEIFIAGELLGKKTILNEFIAYFDFKNYITGKTMINGAVVELSARTKILLSYALCGFANFSSIGIQIAGIGGIAPSRRGDLAKIALRALVAGTFASLLTASIVGLMI